MHKTGFVSIVGNPNVGKSTIMNLLVGERLSIISPKAQTTRHRIFGIVNGNYNNASENFDYQIVYSDTPGFLHPSYRLQEQMLQFSQSALIDADIILLVTDPHDEKNTNAKLIQKIKENNESNNKIPIIIALNKIDLINQKALSDAVTNWENTIPNAIILPLSAKFNFGIDQLKKSILAHLVEGHPFFDKEQLTDKPSRFFASEILREKILLSYKEEIPYCVEVEIQSFQETENHIRMKATIYTERESQKGILIGKYGKALKHITTLAIKDMEDFFKKRVFLSVLVKVDEKWRENIQRLQHYGYYNI